MSLDLSDPFLQALDRSQLGAVVADSECKVLYTNKAFRDTLPDMAILHVTDIPLEEDREMLQSRMDNFFESPVLYPLGGLHLVIKHLSRSGKVSYSDVGIQPLPDDMVLLTFADIKELVAKRNKSVSLFTEIADSIPAMLWLADDLDGIYFTNEAYKDYVGNTGLSWVSLLHPDDKQRVLDTVGENKNKKDYFEIVYRMLHRGQSYRRVLDSGASYSLSGKQAGIAGCTVDISDLESLGLKLDIVKEAFSFGVWEYDADKKTTVADTRLFSIFDLPYDTIEPTKELDTDQFYSRIHTNDLAYVVSEVNGAAANKGNFHARYRVVWRDGSEHYVESFGMFSSFGTLIGACRLRDADEEADRRLRQSNSDLEQFAYVASHDLKEPLRTVSAFTSKLIASLPSELSTDQLRWRDYVNQGCTQMNALIDGLLDYSRIGRIQNEEESFVPFIDLVNDSLFYLRESIQEVGASITFDSPDSVSVYGYRTHLLRLVINLIQNSIKYRRDNTPPEIQISLRQCGKLHKVSFSDNGIGIQKKHWQDVFKPFFKLHSSSKYQGTGMGLALCAKIMALHKGTIKISDSKKNAGTTITVCFPCKRREE